MPIDLGSTHIMAYSRVFKSMGFEVSFVLNGKDLEVPDNDASLLNPAADDFFIRMHYSSQYPQDPMTWLNQLAHKRIIQGERVLHLNPNTLNEDARYEVDFTPLKPIAALLLDLLNLYKNKTKPFAPCEFPSAFLLIPKNMPIPDDIPAQLAFLNFMYLALEDFLMMKLINESLTKPLIEETEINIEPGCGLTPPEDSDDDEAALDNALDQAAALETVIDLTDSSQPIRTPPVHLVSPEADKVSSPPIKIRKTPRGHAVEQGLREQLLRAKLVF